MARSEKTKPVGDLLREKRQEILRIAEKHGARNVRVFGSVAHGEATVSSDIDLLVDTAEETSPWFPAGLVEELERLPPWTASGRCNYERPLLVASPAHFDGSQAFVKKDSRVYLAHILECAQEIVTLALATR